LGLGLLAALGACTTAGRELPPETEAELGRQLSEELDRQMFLLRDTVITAPLAIVGHGIGANAPYPIAPYTFKVIDGESVNAFAVAGGSIYIYRGLIEESTSMGEIAAVLGHEIAHLAAGHASHKLYEYQRSQLGLGQRLDRSRLLFFAYYNRTLEAEADSIAVGLMVAAGWDPFF
jgi:predicted Zn-dependent protease